MDYSGQSMYLNQTNDVTEQSHIRPVPGSIPIDNGQVGIYTQEGTGVPGGQMIGNYENYSQNIDSNNISENHYNQLPLRKEVDEEGRIYSVVTNETPVLPSNEGNNDELEGINDDLDEDLETKIKTEAEEDEAFLTVAHDTLLQIRNNELTLKQGADQLERPYSYLYRRYQEFCNKIDGIQPEKKKGGNMMKKNGKKKRRPKKLTVHKSRPQLSGVIYQCEECPASFYRESQLKHHFKVHLKENESHPCTVCGVVFPKLKKLMRHRMTIHEEALQCPHCEEQFTKIPAYSYHIKTHTGGEKPFKCIECDKGFINKSTLMIHKRIHTGEKPYMCGYCEKAFITITKLKQHHHIHTGTSPKPFECEDCGKCFAANSSMLEHMNIHKGVKPYACDECPARFNFKANLKCHKMVHSGERPYKCDFCPAAFTLSSDLQRHTTVHTGVKPFKCDMCEFSCTRKTSLEYHQNTHTGNTPFKCDFEGCDMEYTRPNSLKLHKLKHGPPPPVTCKVCHEQFPDIPSMKHHMMLHTGEKPYPCDQCQKVCYDKAALRRHMYKHMYKPFKKNYKQIKPKKIYTGDRKPATPVNRTKREPTNGYQVPELAHNAQIIHAQNAQAQYTIPATSHYAWNTNAEDTNSQPATHQSFNPFTTGQYTNIVNNAWPSAMDPDELRRRLLNSFK